jgi:hypothetical protein
MGAAYLERVASWTSLIPLTNKPSSGYRRPNSGHVRSPNLFALLDRATRAVVLWLIPDLRSLGPPQPCCFDTQIPVSIFFVQVTTSFHLSFITLNTVASMLAVLCSTPRPPLGVALLGLLITAISSTLHLLPYIIFCSIIVLSVWVPSRPADPKVVYYPIDGYSQHVYAIYTSDATPAGEDGSFELNACLGVLLFLLSIPVTSVLENLLIRPTRDLFLQTVECWFNMRYVQPLLATGSWPDTWTPLLNALRSFQFVVDFIDEVMGNHKSELCGITDDLYSRVWSAGPNLTRVKKVRWADLQPSNPGRDIGGCSDASSRTHPAVRKTSSPCRAVHRKGQGKLDCKHTSSPDTVIPNGVEQ